MFEYTSAEQPRAWQGRYELGELLGRGGSAEVFAGRSTGAHGFQKPVAIKRLLPELANDDVFVERLIREAKLLVGIQHGNIVSVIDLARDGQNMFLVMEYVDGPSLRQLVARGSHELPLGVSTYIVMAAAAGLEYAHARPGGAVIHADISPSNLLLTTSGEVRVADFGIARREGRVAGAVEGKWAYMAPEQARGEPLTPRSDVFALGVVLYELVTGVHPFGHRVTADDRRQDQLRIIPPRAVRPWIPAGLDEICMRALANDPNERFSRMQSLIDALVEERFANGWREAASDLARAIREMAPSKAEHQLETQITNCPVTIETRSLIIPGWLRGSPPTFDTGSISGSITVVASPPPQVVAPPPEIVQVPAFRPSQPQIGALANMWMRHGVAAWIPPTASPRELASAYGAGSWSGTPRGIARLRHRTGWAISVLVIAALLGGFVALAVKPASASDRHPSAEPAPAAVATSPAAIKPAEAITTVADAKVIEPPTVAPQATVTVAPQATVTVKAPPRTVTKIKPARAPRRHAGAYDGLFDTRH